jgi:activator of HSP90 ATPase
MAEKTRTITQREFIPGVTPGAVYDALLDGKKHSKLIGGKATGNATVGSEFTAWDGYITGTNLELDPGKRILQAWQTSEWPEGAEPSHVEWTFTGEDGGTHVTLVHSNVPAEQADSYRQGWIDYYWTPMKAYFAK